MEKKPWQISHPLDAAIFDCDGTLAHIEGIDELARMNGVFEPVTALTERAMASGDMDLALYERRLDMVKPTMRQMTALGQQYIQTVTPQVEALITCLQRLNKAVFVLSAGLLSPVATLASHLNVPASQVYAVEIQHDAKGNYQDFDRQSPLVTTNGKAHFVEIIKATYPRLALIGDGMNDLAASDYVERFIGYGGAFMRKNVAIFADFYIKTASMAPVLPLVLGPDEDARLTVDERGLYEQGIKLLYC